MFSLVSSWPGPTDFWIKGNTMTHPYSPPTIRTYSFSLPQYSHNGMPLLSSHNTHTAQ